MTRIINGVIIVLFFNTGILICLTNANLSEISSTLGFVFGGVYYDYSPLWYAKPGNLLLHTMFVNAFMPLIFESLVNLQTWLYISRDSGMWCTCGRKRYEHVRYYNTKQKQIYALIDLYAGPEYIIHFKYSGILNVTFVTMMYGAGLPLLFPIAVLSYFILWMVERY